MRSKKKGQIGSVGPRVSLRDGKSRVFVSLRGNSWTATRPGGSSIWATQKEAIKQAAATVRASGQPQEVHTGTKVLTVAPSRNSQAAGEFIVHSMDGRVIARIQSPQISQRSLTDRVLTEARAGWGFNIRHNFAHHDLFAGNILASPQSAEGSQARQAEITLLIQTLEAVLEQRALAEIAATLDAMNEDATRLVVVADRNGHLLRRTLREFQDAKGSLGEGIAA